MEYLLPHGRVVIVDSIFKQDEKGPTVLCIRADSKQDMTPECDLAQLMKICSTIQQSKKTMDK